MVTVLERVVIPNQTSGTNFATCYACLGQMVMSSSNWWDQYSAEDVVEVEEVKEEMDCKSCSWSGVPIDHLKIPFLLCGRCLKRIPGTRRELELPQCPMCGTIRLTSDGNACLECDWPDVEELE